MTLCAITNKIQCFKNTTQRLLIAHMCLEKSLFHMCNFPPGVNLIPSSNEPLFFHSDHFEWKDFQNVESISLPLETQYELISLCSLLWFRHYADGTQFWIFKGRTVPGSSFGTQYMAQPRTDTWKSFADWPSLWVELRRWRDREGSSSSLGWMTTSTVNVAQ